MRTTSQMTEGKQYWETSWDDNNAIAYTLKDDGVHWFTFHRFGKGTSGIRSLAEHDVHVLNLAALAKQELILS